MPLDHYGVLVGALHRFYRDEPDNQGRWFHVNVEVDAPAGRHRCAIDVDSKNSAVGVQWRKLTLNASDLAPATDLTAGYHTLSRAAGSGGLDYYRHPALRPPQGCLFVRRPPTWLAELISKATSPPMIWRTGSHVDAADALEPLLEPGRVALVFGEPFRTGLGMHNIHQNQGDPAGSQWWSENGTWQDGGIALRRPDGKVDVFLSKFSSQSTQTDDEGHPLS